MGSGVQELKTFDTELVEVASRGGNLLLNVGRRGRNDRRFHCGTLYRALRGTPRNLALKLNLPPAAPDPDVSVIRLRTAQGWTHAPVMI